MKTLLSLLVICFFIATTHSGAAPERTVFARITVYWRAEGCGLRASSNGTRLHSGHCAVDPKRIPFGSKLIFPDAICTAVDTGPDVVSRRAARSSGHNSAQKNALVIDRFFETREAAMAWSRANPPYMTIRITKADEPQNRRVAPSQAISSRGKRQSCPAFVVPGLDLNSGLAAALCFDSARWPA